MVLYLALHTTHTRIEHTSHQWIMSSLQNSIPIYAKYAARFSNYDKNVRAITSQLDVYNMAPILMLKIELL